MSFISPKGFRAAGVSAGLKKDGALDLALIVSDRPAAAAGATTRNKFAAPPVLATRERLKRGRLQAIVCNSKIANAATGSRGMIDAERMARMAAQAVGCDSRDVAMASTGVIGRFLPLDKIEAGIQNASGRLSEEGWADAARAIMTTDTRPKDVSLSVKLGKTTVALRGIAKGAGMIHPNMATMLSFIAADAAIKAPLLRKLVAPCVRDTFNMITVDGDTSTSDMAIVMANGAAGGAAIEAGSAEEKKFGAALLDLMRELAVELARDGEGATKLIEARVSGARTAEEARAAARGVTNSNLVKTAVFGCDANWGRLAAAVGNSPARFEAAKVSIKILGVPVMRRGLPVAYDEPALQAEMKNQERIVCEIALGAGNAKATAWGSDFSYDYVKINADYRT